MKKFARLTTVCSLALLATSSWRQAQAQSGGSNRPPEVSVLWPRQDDSFRDGILIKVKTYASDPDGSIAQVQFFAETNLIGVVTDPPFNLVWQVELHNITFGSFKLKAMAVDNLGAKTESAPVCLGYYTGLPPAPIVQISSTRD